MGSSAVVAIGTFGCDVCGWYASSNLCFTKSAWIYIVMAYLFLASVMPMWLLMQPRDYMTTFMLLGMIAGAVLGVLVAHPEHAAECI